jgi:ribosome-associated protein
LSPSSFPLRGEYITLAHAVKAVGLAGTGGHAKILVREGLFTVNDQPENRPGRKLYAADRFSNGEQEWLVEKSSEVI